MTCSRTCPMGLGRGGQDFRSVRRTPNVGKPSVAGASDGGMGKQGDRERDLAERERSAAHHDRELAVGQDHSTRQRRLIAAALHDEAADLFDQLAAIHDRLDQDFG